MCENKRKDIPAKVKLRLWNASAGRCQFQGCNKPLWYDGLTFECANFGEMAHIIAASKDGPRGNEKSEDLQIDFDNLMLLCQTHHKLVDDKPEDYPVGKLKEWKKNHEERIEMLTQIQGEEYKTCLFRMLYNINDRITELTDQVAYKTILPMYPMDGKGLIIEEKDFDKKADESRWAAEAQKIQDKIQRFLKVHSGDTAIKHISSFAIGPMPLLMFYGKVIGSTLPAKIYNAHRDYINPAEQWMWKNESTIAEYKIEETNIFPEKKEIALILALSDTIMEDKYNNVVNNNFSVYKITIDDPHTNFLKTEKQLELFSYEYRKLLNRIQSFHGIDCRIHIMPAVPPAIAVECGRALLPEKDPKIFVYDYSDNGFRKVLNLIE